MTTEHSVFDTPRALIEAIASIAHETNRRYCQVLGDDSQPAWGDAPDWQKDSAIKGVEFHMANPGASASASHDAWMSHKAAEGWRYGPVKNPDIKEHPCMVAYDQLPIEQRRKDYLFKAIVDAFRLTGNG